MIGPTDMGRMLSMELMRLVFLGRGVTMLRFSSGGMSPVDMQRLARRLRVRRPYSCRVVMGLVVGIDGVGSGWGESTGVARPVRGLVDHEVVGVFIWRWRAKYASCWMSVGVLVTWVL